jgi:hypothetical protein
VQASQKNDLKPWRVKSWCLAKPSSRFVAKMEDVLEVYTRPYDPDNPVVCLDELSKQLHSSPYGTQPLRPGQPAKEDYEYTRHGTANLFLAVEPLAGTRTVRVTERRTATDFAHELKRLVMEDYAHAERVVLVTDNLNTHNLAALYEAFPPEQAREIAERIEWHYTPEHGSWLNMAEIELSVLSSQCLNRRIESQQRLKQEVTAWQKSRNEQAVTIDWQFTTQDARIKLRRLYPVLKVQSLG